MWFEENNQECVIRWNDNQVVIVRSKFFAVDLVGHVSRYSRKQKKKIQVSQFHMTSQYIKFMGGIDLADNLLANYCIRIRDKKYFCNVFLPLKIAQVFVGIGSLVLKLTLTQYNLNPYRINFIEFIIALTRYALFRRLSPK